MTETELKTGVAMIMLYETAVQHPEAFPGIACGIDNHKLEATLQAISAIGQEPFFAAIDRMWRASNAAEKEGDTE